MKNLAVALLVGAVSAESLNAQPNIWNESTEGLADLCGDQWSRWNNPSNSWDTFANAYQSGGKWTDSDFGASMEVMYSSSYPPRGGTWNFDNYVKAFKRPEEIFPGEEVHIMGEKGEFAPSGIRQGMIGDCWFLAGAAATSEDPSRMYKVVNENSRSNYNPAGIFRYAFWVENKWVAINIDDRLPARYKYSNSRDYFVPYGSNRSNFGAWWMPLLEKAYAKLNGNYARIEGGSGFESLRQLSGKPVFFFEHEKVAQQEADLYGKFKKFASENYPMVLSCCKAPGDAPDGLQTQHAYTLMDVAEVQGERLAKVRNPWSSEGYSGPWADSDPRWTPSLLDSVGHTKADDGVFFMPFHNMFRSTYFRSTTVNVYKEFSKTTIYDITQRPQELAITFQVPSRQVVYFTLEAQNPRFRKGCRGAKVFVNTYFFPGTRFRGMDSLLFPLGYMGGTSYHVTAGEPDYVFEAGTYTMQVANWGCSGRCTPLDYKLIVSQEGSGRVSVSY